MLQSETEANKVSETCLPRVVSNISEKKQETLLQTTKLSGLRMPSPSLGFFSMAKAPSSHSQVHKISKPCKPAKSNIPKLQNLETNSVNEARVQHLLNENFSVNCSEITGSNLEAVNQQLKGEQLKTTSASMVGEIMSTKESESHLDSCQLVHMTTLSSKGSPQKSTSEIKCAAATEPKTAKIEGFIQTIPVLEQCDKVIYSKAMDHSTQVFELDRMREDCITVSETACNTEVSHVSQENRSFHEDNVQNLLLTSQECPTVKADFVSSDNKMSTSKYCTVSELQLRVEDSSRDASIHYDVPCDVPGNFEQPTSKFTYSKANKMLREDESLVLNPGHLLDQSEFSEVSADIISNTKDFIGSGAEKSSSCLRHTLLTRLVLEVDHVNREIKESHVEDSQMQLLNENPAPYKSNNPENGNNILHSDGDWLPTNIGSSEEIDKAVEDVHARSFNENPVPINCNSRHCLVTNGTDFHRSGAADSDNVNSIQLHLNGDSLSTHVAPSEEIKKTNLFEGALCDIYTSEHNASNNHIQAMPENKDGNISMDDLLVDDAKEGYSDTLPLVEFQLNDNIQTMSENKDGNLDMDDFEEGSSDILPLDEVQLDDSIQAMPENNGRYLDMDYLQVNDSNEGSSDMFPLVEVEVSDNIQTMSENKDGNLDMDDVEEGSSDMLPLDEVQLDDSIQAMPENNGRNLDKDYLQVNDSNEGSSDMFPLVEVEVSDNIQTMSENKDGNLDMDDVEEGSSDILPLDEVQLDDNIQANLDMDYLQVDDANEGPSDMFPLVEVEVSDNIQTMSENKDGNLDMDDVEEGSSDILPLDEVQLDDNIQAMPENNERNLDMDYLQVDDANEGSSDMFPLVEVEVSDNIQYMSENNDGNLDTDDSKKCSSDILPLFELQLIDNIQAISENNDENIDMDDAREGSSDILSLVEVQLDENIQAMPENNGRNLDMDYLQVDDANEGSSDMFPLVEVEVSDNIQTMSENKDGNLDMDDVEEGSSDILPLDEVQLDDNIQAMPENNERNLDMDYLQVDDANEGSSDMFPLVEVEVSDNIQYMSENNDGNLDTDDSKECSSDILPLLELQLIDNIQAISENNDEKLDIDDAKEGSSDILPLVEVQLDENIQAMSENNERNLGMDDLQMDYGKEGSSDMLPLVEVQVNVDKIQLPLDGNWLSTNIASSEENKKTNLSEHALKGCDVRTGEHNTSNDHIQAMPENEDGNLYVDERAEHLQMNDAKKGSSDILALVEVQFKDKVVSSECNSFIEASKDSFTDVFAWKPEEHRSSESSSLPALDNLVSNTRVPQVCEISVLNTTTFLEEAGTNNFEKDESPNTDMEHRSKGDIYYAEGSNKIIHLQESATKSKQEVPTLKPPPNAAPFSDEWVAAIEAAGEEILTMKGGAVQNSPTEKPQHEPGPWSPVRRKNQSIGPFDCTKHNVQHSSP
ncbi:hypothetical protein PHAVU_011G071501 [Phaseolus vulgaris]